MKLSESQMKFFADFIFKELGIVYAPQNYFQLEQRLESISKFLGDSTLEELYFRASTSGITGDFRHLLLDLATNNETSFFRDTKVFQAIQDFVFPKLKEIRPNTPSFRIWSAASSFGQEPYSLGILIDEYLKKNPTHPGIEVLATDVSDNALKRAKSGQYSQLEVQRGLSAIRLVQYFNKIDDSNWETQSQIKNRVQFKKQNLLDPFTGFGQFDVILCRYVLIYQDAERKKEIITRLSKCLVPNGFLILGGVKVYLDFLMSLINFRKRVLFFIKKK